MDKSGPVLVKVGKIFCLKICRPGAMREREREREISHSLMAQGVMHMTLTQVPINAMLAEEGG